MQARDNKTTEVDKLTNIAVDGFSWSPYLLHVILAACLIINQFSLYFWHQAAQDITQHSHKAKKKSNMYDHTDSKAGTAQNTTQEKSDM
jgi:hypothetical protein